MRILILSQYFWPETFIINDLALQLSEKGVDVTVMTGKPNYPDGEIYEGYSKKGIQHQKYQNIIDIYRVPLRPRKSGHSFDLILNYLSFVWSGLRFFPGLVKKKEFDAILVFAPSPITSAITAIPLKWKKKAHLVIWIQDLWPESLAATGHIKNPVILKLVEWAVRGIYHFADSLLIQSRAFREPVGRFANDNKIVYYPNSIYTSLNAGKNSNQIPHELRSILQNSFCVVFAGNIGEAQSVETIVQAALQLKDNPNIRIVLVGSGSRLDWVRKQQEELNLDNLYLAGRFPMSFMPEIYRYASSLLVTLKNEAIFSLTVPSKVQAYLAAGKPIIAALNGEGARIIEESASGYTCAAEDAHALASTIKTLYELDEVSRNKMGENGRAYFNENFEMKRQAEHLIEILEQRITLKKRGC